MRRARKGLLAGLVLLVVALGAPWAVIVLRARDALRAGRARWERDLASARAQVEGVRLPCLGDRPHDENVVSWFPGLAGALADLDEETLGEDATWTDDDLLRVSVFVDRHATELKDVRRALASSQTGFGVTLDASGTLRDARGQEWDGYPLRHMDRLAWLLIADAWLRAHAGDRAGAARCYLEVVRLSQAFSAAGPWQLVQKHNLAHTGYFLLGFRATTADPPLEETVLAGIDRDLAALEPNLPDATRPLEWERLACLAPLLHEGEPTGGEGLPTAEWASDPERLLDALPLHLFPGCVRTARLVAEVEAFFQQATLAARARSSDERRRRLDELEERARSSPSFAVREREHFPRTVIEGLLETRVEHAVVRAAVKLERLLRANGRLPEGAIDLGRDPGAPERPLRLKHGKKRYRVWSVGPNGRDDEGVSDSAWSQRAQTVGSKTVTWLVRDPQHDKDDFQLTNR